MRRVERYHGVSLRDILDEIGYLRDEGDSVVAGGSLAYGLGNRLSDLDLVVTGPSTIESSRIPVEHFIGSLRVDVWKLAQGLIESAFERAEKALISDKPLLGSFGDVDHEDELKLLHRIAFGVVLDGPRLGGNRRDDRRMVASRLVAREYVERMRTSALLAQLALRAERPIGAVVNARLAVEGALNAVVLHRGLPFSGEKWLRERLAGEASDLADVYEPFHKLPEDPAREAGRFVGFALAACAQLWGVGLEIGDLRAAARWRNTDLQMVELGGERLLLSARVGVLWKLEDDEADGWSTLTSEGEQDSKDADTWSLADCDQRTLLLCLRLHEGGVLNLHWSQGMGIEKLSSRPTAEAGG